jgi:hypothetical protein
MAEDPRCCGSGTCIINAQGECWCGQRWNGHSMCHPVPKPEATVEERQGAPSVTATDGESP